MNADATTSFTAQETSANAFDELAWRYDAAEAGNPILQWMRRRVQSVALSVFDSGARILEIGCGTGTDALGFARHGHRIVALDSSAGMLAVARQKLAAAGYDRSVDFEAGSGERLGEVIDRYGESSFDAIFSNFGALNCVASLRQFADDAGALLRPGGKMVLSIMPAVCPWEIGYYLVRFRASKAFRRWRGRPAAGGIAVRLGTHRAQTYYHTRADLTGAFSTEFVLENKFALGLFVPPSYLHSMARFQQTFNTLQRLDEWAGGWPFLRDIGDHVVVVLQRRSDGRSSRIAAEELSLRL